MIKERTNNGKSISVQEKIGISIWLKHSKDNSYMSYRTQATLAEVTHKYL